ncbi:16S rRNA (cytidine(1402)-2'-O)-methyltransferase [Kushneria phosphatilytica]|uniref:Ribosomal RNA small subunit methyltransferase I n=1 Tax=Kushneria phosphatilytica TaxID=657387 RepID=A0A1S1NXD7_9GAMM|nr:16S rRNA (cytidine(1402)-2'-O)-methyltransferase [Kushneria phosphatilytica]OHV12230.1 16S rRNA (cytidine(1402)-2'-O)-methyltransferase [Kushneria phosphatilytica]QEL11430.1 16S rRNA (cytidine(1402)-2'-O)-methyltransferase [Kushneria phosphatilytica]
MSEPGEGALYVVATPIGNLDDLSARAVEVLGQVDLVAAEDTRHSSRLLSHLGLQVSLMSLHDHNEAARVEKLREIVAAGQQVALISDAGTPLISDPGYRVVRALRDAGLRVVPIPGPCALVTALSAAGLPTDRFLFEGFLPARSGTRRNRLNALSGMTATLVFYEAPHRIVALLEDIAAIFGEREVVVARELTKTFETFLVGSAFQLQQHMASDDNQTRGEFVVMVAPAPERKHEEHASLEAEQLLMTLLDEGVGSKQAAAIASRLMGGRKGEWYQRVLTLREGSV